MGLGSMYAWVLSHTNSPIIAFIKKGWMFSYGLMVVSTSSFDTGIAVVYAIVRRFVLHITSFLHNHHLQL